MDFIPGGWITPALVMLLAIGILIAWRQRSWCALVTISVLGVVALPLSFRLIPFEGPLADLLSLLALLVPGFIVCLTLAVAAYFYAPRKLASNGFISTLAIIGLLNCGHLGYLSWQFAKINSWSKSLIQPLCPMKQADAASKFQCDPA